MKVLVICVHVRADSYVEAMAAAYAAGVHTVCPRDQPLEPDLQATLAALEWAEQKPGIRWRGRFPHARRNNAKTDHASNPYAVNASPPTTSVAVV